MSFNVSVVQSAMPLLVEGAGLSAVIEAALNEAAALVPASTREELLAFRWADDEIASAYWIETVLTRPGPPETITGLRFQLAWLDHNGEPPYEAPGPLTCDLTVHGSPTWPEDKGWMCEPGWFPERTQEYRRSAGLHLIHKLLTTADDDALASFGDYAVTMLYAAASVRFAASTLSPRVWLGAAQERAISVGHDDDIDLGVMTSVGLQLPPNLY